MVGRLRPRVFASVLSIVLSALSSPLQAQDPGFPSPSYDMHVKYGSKLTKLIVGTAFFFLGILLTLTLSDYLSRGWFTSPRGSTSAAAITSVTGPLTTGARPLEPAPQNASPK